jgi:hypothetical protein
MCEQIQYGDNAKDVTSTAKYLASKWNKPHLKGNLLLRCVKFIKTMKN